MSLREEICLGDLRLDACDSKRFRFTLHHENCNYSISRIVSFGDAAIIIEGAHPDVWKGSSAKVDDLLNLRGEVTIEIREYRKHVDAKEFSPAEVFDRVVVEGYGSHLYDRKSDGGTMLRYINLKVNKVRELAVTA
jgi:hypothetical protein